MSQSLLGFTVVLACMAALQVCLPRCLDYRVDLEGIALVVFGRWTAARIDFAEITSIRAVSWREGMEVLLGQRWSTRLVGEYVQVCRGDGAFASVVLTPKSADAFTRVVVRHMARRHTSQLAA